MAKVPEWDPYKCTIPATAGIVSNPCSELTEVRHIVHVPDARRIIEDGRIRSGLIYDESRLNRSRLCVVWVSANTWANGSIYGNVEFVFEWKNLVKGKNIYWVEAMPDYSPTAYRLLLTDRDLSKSKHVQPYDPKSDDGPLRKSKGRWYWNASYTSEFMIEEDLWLNDCVELNFVSHHSDFCRLNGTNCVDRKASSQRTGGRVLAHILGNGISSVDHLLLRSGGDSSNEQLNWSAASGIDGVFMARGSEKNFSGGIKKQESRQAVLRGALTLLGSDRRTEAKELISLLNSQDIFEKAFAELIQNHFGFTDYTLPD